MILRVESRIKTNSGRLDKKTATLLIIVIKLQINNIKL